MERYDLDALEGNAALLHDAIIRGLAWARVKHAWLMSDGRPTLLDGR